MLRKLKLYGELAEFVGHKEFEIQVDSLTKAVSFLINNFPQVEKYMNPQYYQVKVGDYAVDQEKLQTAYCVKYQVFLLVEEEVEDYHRHQNQ